VTWALKPNRTRRDSDSVVPKPLVGVPYAEELELAIEVVLKGTYGYAKLYMHVD
jgi:hypothetical protein